MKVYDTMTEGIADLKKRGFTRDFNVAFDHIKCSESGTQLYPSDFEITEVHRFEGDTDPADESVLYAVAAKLGDLKGVLVSGYGMYNDEMDELLLKKLTIHSS